MNCPHCTEPMDPELEPVALGFADVPFMHAECAIRSVVGSVAHLERRCGCFVPGSTEGDPPGMTTRQAAAAAVKIFTQIQRVPRLAQNN